MSRQKSSFIEDKKAFTEWLVNDGQLSRKAASDCVSRCKRVETELHVDLVDATATEASYLSLMEAIQQYAQKKSKTKPSAYSMTGTLRAACKKYAQFKYPSHATTYKSSHGSTRYD